MKKIVLLLAFAAGLATAIPANAGTNCTTTCTGFGNTRTCNTWCY